MKKIVYLLGFIVIASIISCERDNETEAGLGNIAGQWRVAAYKNSDYISGPFTVTTSKDISAGIDSITIKDDGKFWNFKVKAFADEKSGTFKTQLSECEIGGVNIGIKIPYGKVFYPDSIYFEIQFEDDVKPYETTYILKGHRINE